MTIWKLPSGPPKAILSPGPSLAGHRRDPAAALLPAGAPGTWGPAQRLRERDERGSGEDGHRNPIGKYGGGSLGTPKSWMVYGKSQSKMDDLGVPAVQETTLWERHGSKRV